MPISFEQPGALNASPGALEAYLRAVALTRQNLGGGGGGGGVSLPRGWGVGGVGGGDGGGGGVSGGGGGRDDRPEREDPTAARLAAIDALTDNSETINTGNDQLESEDADTGGEADQQGTFQPTPSAPEGDTSEAQDLPQGDTSEADPETQNTFKPTPSAPEGDTSEAQDLPGQRQPPPPTRLQQLQAQRRQLTQGQPPSQAEELHRQRLEQGLATTNQQARAGMLTPQEANDMRTQILTGLNPATMRAQRAHAQMQEAAAQARMHQNAELTSMRNMDGAQTAAYVARHTATLPDGTQIYINPVSGHEHVIPSPRIARAELDHQTVQQQATSDAADDDKFRHHLLAITKEERGTNTGPLTDDQKKRIRERMLQAGYHSDDLNEHQRTRTEQREDRPMEGRPERTWSGRQRATVADLADQRDQVVAMGGMNTGWGQEALHDLTEARNIFRRYGTLTTTGSHGIPQSALTQYQDLLKNARQIVRVNTPGYTSTPPRAPAAAAAAPAAPRRAWYDPSDVMSPGS